MLWNNKHIFDVDDKVVLKDKEAIMTVANDYFSGHNLENYLSSITRHCGKEYTILRYYVDYWKGAALVDVEPHDFGIYKMLQEYFEPKITKVINDNIPLLFGDRTYEI